MITEWLGRFVGTLFIFLVVLGVWYLGLAFTLWQLDVSQWSESMRIIMAVGSVSATAAFLVERSRG